MRKKTLYQIAAAYDLGEPKGNSLFIHDSRSLGHSYTYTECFKIAANKARKDKRLIFAIIFNNNTQLIIKRKWLTKGNKNETKGTKTRISPY